MRYSTRRLARNSAHGNGQSRLFSLSRCTLVAFVINKYTHATTMILRARTFSFFSILSTVFRFSFFSPFFFFFFFFLFFSLFLLTCPSIVIVVPTRAICRTKVQPGWRCRLLRAMRAHCESHVKRSWRLVEFLHQCGGRSDGNFNVHVYFLHRENAGKQQYHMILSSK